MAAVVVLALLAVGQPALARDDKAAAVVPRVIGMRLDKAFDKLKTAGFSSSKAVDRKSRRRIVRKSNWYVIDQSPRATVVARRTVRVELGVRHKGEPRPTTATTTTMRSASPEYAVQRVIDGDTIVLADGRHVRLAQVDAPEATSRTECYGAESTRALVALIGRRPVTLRRPSTAPATDRYGRTLADIYVEGRSVNEELVREGAAEWYEQFKAEDPDLGRRLEAAENEARRARRGLWSACVAPAERGVLPTNAPTTTPPAPTATGNCDPAYPDDCIPPAPPDLNCADIRRRVRVDHTYGDPHGFDRDNDGIGCESYS